MNPAIVPLSPGERPTEPGIYIVKDNEGFRAVEMRAPSEFDGTDQYGDPEVLATPGSDVLDSVGEFQRWGFTFIARIYPDRIGEASVDTSAGIPIFDDDGRPFQLAPEAEEW